MIIKPSTVGDKKYTATFLEPPYKKVLKTVHFGLRGSSTYLDHRDILKRQNYIKRHKPNENWRDGMSAGALSRFILWGEKTTLNEAIRAYKQRFKFV